MPRIDATGLDATRARFSPPADLDTPVAALCDRVKSAPLAAGATRASPRRVSHPGAAATASRSRTRPGSRIQVVAKDLGVG
jgi:hypothetical protein